MTTTENNSQTTALDLWNKQLAGLTDPAQADAAINTIYERLMKLHAGFEKNGMDKQAALVATAYEQALGIYNDLQQRQALIEGGAAAIRESETAREKAVSELKDLLDAIKEGDEEHPLLEKYAQEIREDQHEETLNDPYILDGIMEGAYQEAASELDDAQNEAIRKRWDIHWRQADRLLGILSGVIIAKPEQEDLIRQLLATIPSEPPHDPLAHAFHSVGAFHANPIDPDMSTDEVDSDDFEGGDDDDL